MLKSRSLLVSCLLWIAAFLLTAASAVYQKTTGPSYAVKGTVRFAGGDVAFKLPRSHGGPGDAEFKLHVPDTTVAGVVKLRRFRSHDEWREQPLERAGDVLVGRIPHQPLAGKVMYQVTLTCAGQTPAMLTAEPVVIRFRGAVPGWVLLLHVLFVFAGMFLSTRTGFEALRRGRPAGTLARCTLGCLVIGGLVFGPIVQKYAFDAFWTGWPYGHDLTDNKIVVAVFFWALAVWRTRKRRPAAGWVLAAAAVTLVVWLIPHSVLGSELDYTQTPSTAPAALRDAQTDSLASGLVFNARRARSSHAAGAATRPGSGHGAIRSCATACRVSACGSRAV